MNIRELDKDDLRYAFYSWRESLKDSIEYDGTRWGLFKASVAPQLEQLLKAPDTELLGAYTASGKLIGWLAMTPGKRVHTVHWVYVKHDLDGENPRRRGVMTALLDAADLGSRFIYTFRSRRDRAQLPDGSVTKSLDESLVAALRARGVTATYVALKEWLK